MGLQFATGPSGACAGALRPTQVEQSGSDATSAAAVAEAFSLKALTPLPQVAKDLARLA